MKSYFKILLAATLVATLTVLAIATNTHSTATLKKKTKQETTARYHAGDIVFQESHSMQCEAVKAATGSQWSHCGIVLPHAGKLMVLEAVQPVQWEEIDAWKKRGNNNVMKVKRLKSDSVLTDEAIAKMVKFGEPLVGKNYDIYFNWSNTEWYCSELVWKIYKDALGLDVGTLKPLKDYNLQHPLVKEIMQQRYGSSPPLNELMISPGAIFESALLKDVE